MDLYDAELSLAQSYASMRLWACIDEDCGFVGAHKQNSVWPLVLLLVGLEVEAECKRCLNCSFAWV